VLRGRLCRLFRLWPPPAGPTRRQWRHPRSAGGAFRRDFMSSLLRQTTVADKANEPARDKVLRKCRESVEMKEKFFTQYAEQIELMARDMAKRFDQGKKLLVMGNGGSLCDALHFSVEFTHPIIEKRRAFPVIPLMTDIATLTAISNDIDYSRVF